MLLQYYRFAQPFELECGAVLPEYTLAYTTYGALNEARDNVVWVCHALTGNALVHEWWPGLIGENLLLDPRRHFIICANMPGSCYGSTYALSQNPSTGIPYYYDFPMLTTRDMVRAYENLRKQLGIPTIQLGLGGSMGGQQILEWAIEQPEVVQHIIPIATNACHSAWGIAFNEAQRMAIASDATWGQHRPDAGKQGMRAARAMALISYRSYGTYAQTQTDPDIEKLENFRAVTYQQYQGDKLAKRFDAFAYWTLSKAMDAHNVGRSRGGIEKALALIKAKTLVIGVSSDVLFPVNEQKLLAHAIPNAQYTELDSLYGHDGFLIEFESLSRIMGDFLGWEGNRSE